MAKRYLPRTPFACYVGGVRRVFNPDYRHPKDGLSGYPELPAGLNKMQLESFYSFDVAEADELEAPVEQATAEPGVKRSVKKRKSSGEDAVAKSKPAKAAAKK